MPIYCYKCHDCRKTFEIRHGMFFENQRCIHCQSDNIFREPNLTEKKVEGNSTKKAGKIVDKYIEDAKSEIKKEKQKLRTEQL